ncbi:MULTISPECIES: ankyrin repeat domain-containing protein [Brevibacterium]|uniref:Ankyrin repeat domain-containing protein n=2 Tax=Brevibacterium TaxID=1696 RepID=A0A7T3ZYF2_9MICO|nr:ankyrin repeat domain-containing protein [Brevibacterium casei]QQB13923.1 ankyrin repeat domain-containing protein [Brevibacterium casei]
MAKKLVTLPKDFREFGEPYTLAELQEIYERRSVDARGGYDKQTALAFSTVDVDGVRWLLDQGADIEAESRFGNSPLVTRARAGDVEVVRELVERGADPIRSGSTHTPLAAAAEKHRLDIVRLLLDAGAISALHEEDIMGWTALDLAAIRCEAFKVEQGLPVVELLVERGGELSKDARPYLSKAMKELRHFESAGNARPETVDAMIALLRMFDIELPSRPRSLAGGEPITVTAIGWKKQFSELWDMLVPGNGSAESVQGEVIRIAGRVGYELLNNGGANWDDDFDAMVEAYARYVRSGEPLTGQALRDVDRAIKEVSGGRCDPTAVDVLTETAVSWVLQNPERTGLGVPDYAR